MINGVKNNYEVVLGTFFTAIIVAVLGFVLMAEPTRIETASQQVIDGQISDAMAIYAENCALCHGIAGEGIGTNPPLNSEGLRGMDPSDLYKTISRGRYNTAMPAWEDTEGGPLTEYQVDELVTFIQYADWQATSDMVVNMGLAPLIPFTTEPDPELIAQVAALPNGEVLAQALTTYSAQCVSCHGADGLGTSIAPAINSVETRSKTTEEIERIIQLGVPGTLMAGWQNILPADQVSAMIELVTRWEEIPLGTVPAPDVPIQTTAESIALGSQLFTANCSMCHGPEGQGTQRAPSLNVQSFLTNTNDQAMELIITNGVPGTAMPAWGTRMVESDIEAIVGFIRQWEPTAPEVASPVRGRGGPRWAQTNSTATLPQGSAESTVHQQELGNDSAAQGSENGLQGQGSQGQGGFRGGQGAASTIQTGSEPLDWRILTGIFLVLAVAFSLVSAGMNLLRQSPRLLQKRDDDRPKAD